jgi:hypothetical protein
MVLPLAIDRLLLIVVVPVPAPTPKVVAAPAKFTVVAVVLIKSKLVLGVVRLVVIAGLVIAGVAPKLVRLLAVTPLVNVLPVKDPAAALVIAPQGVIFQLAVAGGCINV